MTGAWESDPTMPSFLPESLSLAQWQELVDWVDRRMGRGPDDSCFECHGCDGANPCQFRVVKLAIGPPTTCPYDRTNQKWTAVK